MTATTDNQLALLHLIHLADSALPIGATPHSFGLETLTAEGDLTAERVAAFLRDYVREVGLVDAAFCGAAQRLIADQEFEARWLDLNQQLSALKLARESRAASQTLGRRLLELVQAMQSDPYIDRALRAAKSSGIHHCAAFGLVGGALGIDREVTVMAYLHQSVAGLLSACQRLLPVGQRQASQILWGIKPTLIEVTHVSLQLSLDEISPVTPLLDVASMRHPTLSTRLFIS
ncbi:MAG: hypothetical protein KF726_24190 [Anaerolineae bacterium]|nr:hypothetical protein [Anaerolineae bacterium]